MKNTKVNQCLNLEPAFDSLVEHNLGAYVYVLVDPKDKTPFYVGKGGGSGSGNKRLLDHFEEARVTKVTKENHSKTLNKIQKIHEIWNRGQEVDWFVYQIDKGLRVDHVAEVVESALIDFAELLNPQMLTNINRGKYGKLMSRSDTLALGAKELTSAQIYKAHGDIPIMLFNIKKGYQTESDLFRALIRAWILRPDLRSLENAVAIGLIDGVSHIAKPILGWQKSQHHNGRFEILADKDDEKYSWFQFKNFKDIISHVGGFWGQGAAGGPIVFKVNAEHELRFLRGKRDNS